MKKPIPPHHQVNRQPDWQNFNVENELESVTVNSQTTTFACDAGRIRVKTTRPDNTIIDSPFPDYEVENPGRASQTIHITLSIAQRLITTTYYPYDDYRGPPPAKP